MISKLKTEKIHIVYLSTFPPRECGIATFTQDLSSACDNLYSPNIESSIVALNTDAVSRSKYPSNVIDRINQMEPKEYVRVAKKLSTMPEVKLINIQHEFGIHGGICGRNIIYFMKNVEKPIITTFHSVIPTPDPILKETVVMIAEYSSAIIVMTRQSRDLLISDYGLTGKKIHVISHGIHPTVFNDSRNAKNTLGLSEKTLFSTFGLLSKDKGIEYVIQALPQVVRNYPMVLYLVIGATHPVVLKKEGEKYRNFLIKKVYDLKLTDHVRFYNRYLNLTELLEFLEATDVYISSSLNPNQAVSGTLSYALGVGRPVISTSFSQAKEIISPSVGLLVDFKNPSAYSQAMTKLLADPELRKNMSREAYYKTRNMTWPNIAIAYMKISSKIAPSLAYQEKNLPKVKLSHLIRMSDKFGMFQFANMAEADTSSGYTVDDNARALTATTLHYEKFKTPTALRLLSTYLNFMEFSQKNNGYFSNYVNHDKTFNTKANTEEDIEDATGRALNALAIVATVKSIPNPIKAKAKKLFLLSINRNVRLSKLRAAAFFIKGLSRWLSSPENSHNDKNVLNKLSEHCDLLVYAFRKNSKKNWSWFEPVLTYSNASLPDALVSAFLVKKRRNPEWFDLGQGALEFLIESTFINGIYVPIGQKGWYPFGGQRSLYDQQPEETSSMVQALKTIYLATKDDRYRKLMYTAFYWYLGDNLANRIMYDAVTGGCYDGLGKKQVNLNQGAESTVSYLTARLTL